MSEMDFVSMKIIRELCMDGRIPVSILAKRVGAARSTVIRKLKFLEREIGLRYTIEFNTQKLGLPFCYLISVRLRREFPPNELAELLSKSKIPQFAAICKGEFDLLIYATAKTNIDYIRWEYDVRSTLEDDLVSWKASHIVFARHGFFPIRSETLESLELPQLDKKMLIELNNNARISFKKLAKKTGCSLAQVRYKFKQLLKSGLIRRFTAVMLTPPLSNNIAYFLYYTFRKEHEEMSIRARNTILSEEELVPENTYCIVFETSGAADGCDWVAADDIKTAYMHVKEIERIYQGNLRTESAAVIRPVLGMIPARSMDLRQVYDTSSWED